MVSKNKKIINYRYYEWYETSRGDNVCLQDIVVMVSYVKYTSKFKTEHTKYAQLFV